MPAALIQEIGHVPTHILGLKFSLDPPMDINFMYHGGVGNGKICWLVLSYVAR